MDNHKSRYPKWEVENVGDIVLPNETYGICGRTTCHNVGELGNGICQQCWDKGVGRASKRPSDLPNIYISFTTNGG